MYTECPSCETYFKITPNQLKAAGGKVRCGNCDEVFSALDGLVDVVPEEAVDQAASDADKKPNEENNSQLEAQSQVLSEMDAPSELSISELKVDGEAASEAALNELEGVSDLVASQPGDDTDKSMSFADVEIPGMNDAAAEDDIELALETALVGEPEAVDSELAEPGTESAESKSVTEQQGINQDIDAALDGLFDGNTEIAASEDTAISKPESAVISELSAISELDELQDLDFGDLGKVETETKTAAALESEIAAKQSEIMSSGLGSDKKREEEVSSLSEFERELGQLSDVDLADNKAKSLDESNFNLGDSFFDSEPDVTEVKDAEGSKAPPLSEDSEMYSGDSFILEELDEKKTTSGGGVVAKVAWVSLILILLVVLLGQFAYLKRQDLAMYPEVKPIIEKLCMNLNKVYPCDIAAAKDVTAIELLERNVISHPSAKNALLITSTIVNNAKFDQAFPDLILTFSDINQKIIAKRKFSPNEYLSKEVDIKAGMKKSVPIKLMLEIVDPGEEAVNFEFNFQ